MKSLKKTNKLILFMVIIAIVVSLIIIPTSFALESNGDFTQLSSLMARIIADKRDIGIARITTYIHLKPSGDGLFMIEGRIDPKINDGANDYQVRWFTLDLLIGDALGSLNNITYKDNSSQKIITEGSGASLTLKNNGVSFNVSKTTSMTYNTTSVRANYTPLESLPGNTLINKSIYIEPIKSTKDTSYAFTATFFFKFNNTPDNSFYYSLEMDKIRVDGIFLAPDYGTNNDETMMIGGSCDLNGFSACDGQIYNAGKDGSPNDWLEKMSFNSI